MNKEMQEVIYRPIPGMPIIEGTCAIVYALNHPRLHEQEVRTSTVQDYDVETGVFMTLNTIYTPEK